MEWFCCSVHRIGRYTHFLTQYRRWCQIDMMQVQWRERGILQIERTSHTWCGRCGAIYRRKNYTVVGRNLHELIRVSEMKRTWWIFDIYVYSDDHHHHHTTATATITVCISSTKHTHSHTHPKRGRWNQDAACGSSSLHRLPILRHIFFARMSHIGSEVYLLRMPLNHMRACTHYMSLQLFRHQSSVAIQPHLVDFLKKKKWYK